MPRRSTPALAAAAGAVTLLAITLLAGAAEAGLRLLGRAAPARPPQIEVEPGGRYQVSDPVLGFKPLPGQYRVTFGGRYPWSFTNHPDTTRVTRPLTAGAPAPRPGLWVFGCSFVQGWGLDDESTLPWKLQTRLPEYDVVNFGVGGYGTLQSWLQLQQALRERTMPRLVVLAYAGFHDERNTRTSTWRDAGHAYARFGTTAQPFARFDRDRALRLDFDAGAPPLMWLRERSRLVNAMFRGYGAITDRWLDSHEVSAELVARIAEECRRRGVSFVLVGIWPSPETSAMVERMRAAGVPAADVSVDQRDPANLIAYDGHPSAVANDQHAARIVALLGDAGLVGERP